MKMIDYIPPICKTYLNAYASPTVITSPPNGSISGCLYTEDGYIIPESQRFGGFYGDFFPSVDPETIQIEYDSTITKINGHSIYLGHIMPHYGHFLIEMLSSFHTFENFNQYDNFIFHPFVFGENHPSYITDTFRIFGIPDEKIHVIKTKTYIEEVTIPERLVKLNKSAKSQMRNIYNFLIQSFNIEYSKLSLTLPRWLYFSRVRNNLRIGMRTVLNEPLLENAIKNLGFTIVYPELLSFAEQIALIHQADIICGLSGSALHNCVFMHSGSLLIEIADARSPHYAHPTQQICNELSKTNPKFITFHGVVLNKKKYISIIRIRTTIRQLNKIIDSSYQDIKKKQDRRIPKNNPAFPKAGYRLRLGLKMILKNSLRLIKAFLQSR